MACAEVIPFPVIRRKAFLAKNGRHAAEYRPQAAFRYIGSLVDRHRQRLQRLGVEPGAVEADAVSLAAALHAELCRFRMCDGGAA